MCSLVQECPTGLHFNAGTKRCEPPHEAGCVPTSPSSTLSTSPLTFPTTTTRTSTLMSTATSSRTSTTEARSTPHPGACWCPGPDGLFQHPLYCHMFCDCSDGVPGERECPTGLHFNSERKDCELPRYAGCDPISSTLPSFFYLVLFCAGCHFWVTLTKNVCSRSKQHCQFFSQKKIMPDNWFLVYVVLSATPSVGCACPEKDGHFPHPVHCWLFCVCHHFVPETQQCPHGKHFNRHKRRCENPRDAGCEVQTTGKCQKSGLPAPLNS